MQPSDFYHGQYVIMHKADEPRMPHLDNVEGTVLSVGIHRVLISLTSQNGRSMSGAWWARPENLSLMPPTEEDL